MAPGGLRLGAEVMRHGGVEAGMAENPRDREISAGIAFDGDLGDRMPEQVDVHVEARPIADRLADRLRHGRLGARRTVLTRKQARTVRARQQRPVMLDEAAKQAP